ncbi:MAG TPA: hypothetical protein VF590_13135, partial [Isosphaeraceae bacterium]
MPYLEFGREVTRSTICVDRWQVTVTLMGPDRIPPGGTAPLLLVLTWRRRQDGGETPGRPDDAQPVVLTLRKATPAARGDIRFDGRDGPVVKGFGGVDVRGFLTLHGQAATAGAAADIVLAVSIEGQERGTIPLAVRAPEGDVAIRQENETDPAPDFLVPGRPARLKAARTPSGPGTFRWQSAVPDVLAIRGDARAEVAQVEVPAGSGAPGPPALVALAVLFTPQGGGPAVMAVHEVWPLTAPEAPGPYPVGRTAYTAPDLTIPAGLEGVLSDVVVRLEALVRYPAALAGDNTPVSARRARYPLVILAHGRHGAVEFERDPDGSPRLDAVCRRTPLRAGPTSFPEFKSHEGLEYLAAHLASHGMIAVSINLNGQFDPATGRGALVALGAGAATCRPFQVQEVGITHRGLTILRHIREMEDKDNGDPLFSGRINLGAIGLIGHSRGGEAVVSAGEINASTLIPPLQLAIKAIASIAP